MGKLFKNWTTSGHTGHKCPFCKRHVAIQKCHFQLSFYDNIIVFKNVPINCLFMTTWWYSERTFCFLLWKSPKSPHLAFSQKKFDAEKFGRHSGSKPSEMTGIDSPLTWGLFWRHTEVFQLTAYLPRYRPQIKPRAKGSRHVGSSSEPFNYFGLLLSVMYWHFCLSPRYVSL